MQKFIVFEDCLMMLFTICSVCHSSTSARISRVKGTFVSVLQECTCGWSRIWNSQPFLGSIPAGNLLLSSSMLFTGTVPSKMLRVLRHMNMCSLDINTFLGHQRKFLFPVVEKMWMKEQTRLINELKESGGSVIVGGDGRADSPGHSATYGSYSLIELKSGKVIDIQLVQVISKFPLVSRS